MRPTLLDSDAEITGTEEVWITNADGSDAKATVDQIGEYIGENYGGGEGGGGGITELPDNVLAAGEVADAVGALEADTALEIIEKIVVALETSTDLAANAALLTTFAEGAITEGGSVRTDLAAALANTQSYADSVSKLAMFTSYSTLTPEERAEVVGLFLSGPGANGPVNPGEMAYVDVEGLLTGWWFDPIVEGLFNATEDDFETEDTRISTFVTDENGTQHVFQTADELGLGGGGGLVAATTTEQITGTSTTVAATPDSVAALWEAGANVAAAATTTLGFGGYFTITGNTGITAFAFTNDKAGRTAKLRFTGTPAITHHATSCILPGGANIQIVAGATATIVSLGSTNFAMTDYEPGDVTGTGARVLATSPTFVTPALGTPSSGVITNCTGGPTLTSATLVTPALGVPASGDITNCTGAPTLTSATLVTPALGTPSAGVLTNCTGLPAAALVATTVTAIGVGSIELGNATDTTIARSGSGAITVEGVQVILSGAALGTPASGTLTNCTGLPVAGLTSTVETVGTQEGVIYAHEMTASITSGAEPIYAETATNDKMIIGWAFDTSADEFAQAEVYFPKRYNDGTFTFRFHWYQVSSNATASVTWVVEAQAIGNGDALDGSWGTAVRVVDDGGTALTRYISDATAAVTAANTPAALDTIYFRFSRDVDGNGTAGNDDLAQDAILNKVTYTWTSDAGTDA
jgi:hypothetical protein